MAKKEALEEEEKDSKEKEVEAAISEIVVINNGAVSRQGEDKTKQNEKVKLLLLRSNSRVDIVESTILDDQDLGENEEELEKVASLDPFAVTFYSSRYIQLLPSYILLLNWHLNWHPSRTEPLG